MPRACLRNGDEICEDDGVGDGRRSRRAEEDERSLMAKALEEQAAAMREDRQWQAQQRKAKKMQQEEAAAVRSANSMYTTHMAPLKDIEAMSTYEKKLERSVL